MAKTNGKTKSQRGGQTNVMAKRTERLNSNLKGGTNERHGQTNGKTKFETYLHWDALIQVIQSSAHHKS